MEVKIYKGPSKPKKAKTMGKCRFLRKMKKWYNHIRSLKAFKHEQGFVDKDPNEAFVCNAPRMRKYLKAMVHRDSVGTVFYAS